MCIFFSKFLRKHTKQQKQIDPRYQEFLRAWKGVLSGKTSPEILSDFEDLFDSTTPETKRLQKEIDGIKQRLSTLEVGIHALAKNARNQTGLDVFP